MFDRDKLLAALEVDEGFVPVVYDDATGKPIGPGSQLIGNPTAGFGWALNKNPLSRERWAIILGWQVDDKAAELFAALPWAQQLDDVRCRALLDMAFQLGAHGLLGFHDTLAAMKAGRWDDAAEDMLKSNWAVQTPARAKRMAEMVRTGRDVSGV